MDYLDSFRSFILHKNFLIREGNEMDAQLVSLANAVTGEYLQAVRELDAQVKNKLNLARQLKNKCNNELMKIQTSISELVTDFHVNCTNSVIPAVLPYLDDEGLKARLKKDINADLDVKYESIEMIDM